MTRGELKGEVLGKYNAMRRIDGQSATGRLSRQVEALAEVVWSEMEAMKDQIWQLCQAAAKISKK